MGDTPRTHTLLSTHQPCRITPSQTILQLRYQVSVDSTLYFMFVMFHVKRCAFPAFPQQIIRSCDVIAPTFSFSTVPFVILQQPLASPHRLRLHHFATWTGSVHESGVSRETPTKTWSNEAHSVAGKYGSAPKALTHTPFFEVRKSRLDDTFFLTPIIGIDEFPQPLNRLPKHDVSCETPTCRHEWNSDF